MITIFYFIQFSLIIQKSHTEKRKTELTGLAIRKKMKIKKKYNADIVSNGVQCDFGVSGVRQTRTYSIGV